MLSQTQESLIASAAGTQGKVILLFDEDEAGRKGRAEAHARLARSVETTIVKLGAEGAQPDHLPPAALLALLR